MAYQGEGSHLSPIGNEHQSFTARLYYDPENSSQSLVVSFPELYKEVQDAVLLLRAGLKGRICMEGTHIEYWPCKIINGEFGNHFYGRGWPSMT